MHDAIQDPGLAAKFETYFSRTVCGGAPAKVVALSRIHGGASRETYSIDIEVTGETKGVVLRRDPAASLIETDRAVEFAAIRSVADQNIPAPEAVALETDSAALGAPFFVMGRIDGGEPANPFKLTDLDPHRTKIGAAFFEHLGSIAAVPVTDSPLEKVVDTPTKDTCWQRELTYWSTEIANHQAKPEPIAEAAIRWLKANPPPPAQRLSIVHGDYRTGNFLHDGNGGITAVLDWEMAHIGDPFEDLAWATDPLWSGGDPESAAGFLPWPEAIATWQTASGCQFNPVAFEWWSIFSSVKGLGIWMRAADTYAKRQSNDPILAWSGWFTHAAHDLILASRLAPKFGVEIPQ